MLASDPKHYGGGLTADASDKLARFVDLCDQFRLPVVNFVDQPGFVIGTESERAGRSGAARARCSRSTRRRSRGSRCWCARSTASRAPATATHSRLNLRYAWPSGDWGSLPIAGGLEAAYRRELEAADDPAALRAEIEARLDAVRSPFRTAERFGVEEIIDPRDTRPLLCDWAARAHELVGHELGRGPEGARPAALRPGSGLRAAEVAHEDLAVAVLVAQRGARVPRDVVGVEAHAGISRAAGNRDAVVLAPTAAGDLANVGVEVDVGIAVVVRPASARVGLQVGGARLEGDVVARVCDDGLLELPSPAVPRNELAARTPWPRSFQTTCVRPPRVTS